MRARLRKKLAKKHIAAWGDRMEAYMRWCDVAPYLAKARQLADNDGRIVLRVPARFVVKPEEP